jgi:hypothetical protein
MKKFHYHSVEKRTHNGKHMTRKVIIKGNKGHKSITYKKGSKNRTIKRLLKYDEIESIKRKKFIRGLFVDCK